MVATVTNPAVEPLVFPCLRSLGSLCREAYRASITVVVNSPGSGIAQALRNEFRAVHVIENPSPRGFAANHNGVLARDEADYFLITNDDVVFLEGSLERALAYLEAPEHQRVAVVGFRLLNADGTLQPSTYRFLTLRRAILDLSGLRRLIRFGPVTTRIAKAVGRGEGRSRFWPHDRTLPVDTFRGAAMLVRGEAVQQVGLMDEVSLVGGEEGEWHYRFRRQGWSVVFLHDAPVIHLGGQTVRHVLERDAEYLKGALNFMNKHRSRASYWTLRAVAVPVVGLRILVAMVRRRPETVHALRAMWRTARYWRAPDRSERLNEMRTTAGLRRASLEPASDSLDRLSPPSSSL